MPAPRFERRDHGVHGDVKAASFRAKVRVYGECRRTTSMVGDDTPPPQTVARAVGAAAIRRVAEPWEAGLGQDLAYRRLDMRLGVPDRGSCSIGL